MIYSKACRILQVLSAFEESSAECISEMLIHFSNQAYLEGVDQAGKFICHIDALFNAIDEIEMDLSKHNDRTSLQHNKEPKQLAKRVVHFFSLLSHGTHNESTRELISLVTGLAHTLKVLIRAALNGALKLVSVKKKRHYISFFFFFFFFFFSFFFFFFGFFSFKFLNF